ncbi:STMN1 [Cordylochernes scorpioides]|uniref:STMN1 n=1 Tax=Cordylochernes scorpioides TaxID=51811 RepID=A0ABY6L9L1_9ARAC|nr:STMN1 [Cordylochernes scorpioides]
MMVCKLTFAEVRATEQSKGGIKYDLVLADSSSPVPVKASPTPKLNLSDIETKLQAARERKKTLEERRLSQLQNENQHLSEVLQKKQEKNNNFIQVTRDTLEQKIEGYKENRQAYIESIKGKLKEHLIFVPLDETAKMLMESKLEEYTYLNVYWPLQGEHVEEVRKSLEEQQQTILASHLKKLEAADEVRTTQIEALRERLSQHDKHIMEVRRQLSEQMDNKRNLINKKLEDAQSKRELILKEIQEKIHEHVSTVCA